MDVWVCELVYVWVCMNEFAHTHMYVFQVKGVFIYIYKRESVCDLLDERVFS